MLCPVENRLFSCTFLRMDFSVGKGHEIENSDRYIQVSILSSSLQPDKRLNIPVDTFRDHKYILELIFVVENRGKKWKKY